MSNQEPEFAEEWINLPDGQAMCALIHGEVGWLMYLRGHGDAGFSSRNPAYAGSPDAQVEYQLGNGQRDLYPAAWALPVAEVQRALAYFTHERQPPPFVVWNNDSGNGTAIPHEV